MHDTIEFYLQLPESAVVLCVDEENWIHKVIKESLPKHPVDDAEILHWDRPNMTITLTTVPAG